MLVIREEQLEELRRLDRKGFEDELLIHIRKHFPEECEQMGEDSHRDFIKLGINKAENYKITTRRSVCKLIDIMLTVGEDFDETERYKWARQILERQDEAENRVDAVIQRIIES